MALKYNIPHTDDLACVNPVCRERATCIAHLKDGRELFYCQEHFPMGDIGKGIIDCVEELRVPGERNR